MKRILIAYYSRTNTTKQIAEFLAGALNCDIEQIETTKDRKGPVGYLMSGRESTLKIPAEIKSIQKNPADYDMVIVGTPIWSFTLSSPIHAYLEQNKEKLPQVAYFCTMGGSGDQRAFSEMERISGKKPLATLTLLTKEVLGIDLPNVQATKRIKDFIAKIPRE